MGFIDYIKTYKRFFILLVLLTFILSFPITLSLLNQQEQQRLQAQPVSQTTSGKLVEIASDACASSGGTCFYGRTSCPIPGTQVALDPDSDCASTAVCCKVREGGSACTNAGGTCTSGNSCPGSGNQVALAPEDKCADGNICCRVGTGESACANVGGTCIEGNSCPVFGTQVALAPGDQCATGNVCCRDQGGGGGGSSCTCTNGKIFNGDQNYTGVCGEQVCGNDQQLYTCRSTGWGNGEGACGITNGCGVPATLPGQCENGQIIHHISGEFICSDYTGDNNEGVCGVDHKNYRCQNGTWIVEPGTCGTGSCSGIICGGACWSAASCPNGGQQVCNEETGRPFCSGGTGGGGTTPTATPTKTPTPTPTKTVAPTTPPTAVPTATSGPGQPTATTAPGKPTATPTIPTNATRLAIDVGLPGIGPNASVGQNQNPVRTGLAAQIAVFNAQNQKVKDANATLIYNAQAFGFSGEANLGDLASGAYTIKLKLSNTLWKAVARFINGGQSNLIQTPLITGDIDQNNTLDLIDYNLLISCYQNNPCPNKEKSDLNIDGMVDEKDLNILYAAFSTRVGD